MPTLRPIVMEVENGVLKDVFSLQMGYFPLPLLWEEGSFSLRQASCSAIQLFPVLNQLFPV